MIVDTIESSMPAEDRLDIAVPCFRKILEHIVLGCLEVQIPIYGRKTSTSRWHKSKASELVKKVNPKFYPNPTPDFGEPYARITPEIRDCDALTQEQWLTAWDFANQIVHVQNPVSEKRRTDTQKSLQETLKWTQRIINLLSCHTIIPTNTEFYVHVFMEPKECSGAEVHVMERETEWAASHRLPNGGRIQMQLKNEDGEWHDTTDSETAALAFVRLHGIYTSRGFFRPQNP